MEVLRQGYRIPFLSEFPLSSSPMLYRAYDSMSIKGRALEEELGALLQKGAVEPADPSPGFFMLGCLSCRNHQGPGDL